MDLSIAVLLFQDGVTSGAIYALIGVTIVMVFVLTRIIFLFVGEFVAFSALSFTLLQQGRVPSLIWMVAALGLAAFAITLFQSRHMLTRGRVLRAAAIYLAPVAIVALLVTVSAGGSRIMAVNIVLTLALISALSVSIYRIAFERLQNASILMLLIAAVAVHLVLVSLGLYFFGADGARSPRLVSGAVSLWGFQVSWQSVAIYVITILTLLSLFLFFERTYTGAAMRAAAVNRVGANLVGISSAWSGQVAFALGGLVAAVAGILIGPTTTIFYDTGFIIGLKGFVAAVLGALVSYPATAVAALGIGVLESYSAFFASQYKEVIVFSTIFPVLLARSLLSRSHA